MTDFNKQLRKPAKSKLEKMRYFRELLVSPKLRNQKVFNTKEPSGLFGAMKDKSQPYTFENELKLSLSMMYDHQQSAGT